jgi:hypothetical protein
LLGPDLPQDLHRRNLAQHGPLPSRLNGGQQCPTILAHGGRQGPACGFGFGQLIILHALAVAIKPRNRNLLPQPVGSDHGQAVERGAQGFPDSFQAIHGAHGRQHVRGVSALPTPLFEHPDLLQPFQQGVQQQSLGLSRDEPGAKLAQHAEVKAGIVSFQA